MRYAEHYDRLIERARGRVLEGYSERHHIVPVCMGGGHEWSNLVSLTSEEHQVAHLLLMKMHPSNAKLMWAATAMTMDANGQRVGNKKHGWLMRMRVEGTRARWNDPAYREMMSSIGHAVRCSDGWKNVDRTAFGQRVSAGYVRLRTSDPEAYDALCKANAEKSRAMHVKRRKDGLPNPMETEEGRRKNSEAQRDAHARRKAAGVPHHMQVKVADPAYRTAFVELVNAGRAGKHTAQQSKGN